MQTQQNLRSTNHPARKTTKYNKIPTNGRRKNRITSSSTLLKVDAEANLGEEDEEDEEEEEIDYERQVQTQQQQQHGEINIEDEDDDDDDDEEEDLELYNLNRNSKKLAQHSKKQTEELNTFVRVPLKKTKSQEQRETQRT
ncbi:hypothetical protein FF38_07329 [Lucilia cuprina]|uniref:Uncharacterized protein n=1 Tax=Lucilia cuprina TaxID=7375 RepID=A0A0L0BQK1_LUCCU|nr:hypothetical protein FF38_07329 [Lucilia cuprina]